jgi:hypothetical protein
MGSTLACCGKNEADPNNLTTTGWDSKGGANIKLAIVVKIQAHMRGFLARKRVKRIRNQGGSAGKSMMYYNNMSN